MKYSIEIIESAIDNKKITTKDYTYPCVYPIIIYTGEKKWNVKTKFEQVQENLYETRDVEFTKYNLIDINLISKEELLTDKSFLSKILLIEKSKTEKDLINSLNDIVKIDLSRNEKDFLKRLIYFILKEKLPTKEVENLFKKLEEKEELNMRWMQLLSDTIDKRFEDGVNKGIIESIFSIAKKMLEKNMEIREIQEITGLSKEEIEKLAKN